MGLDRGLREHHRSLLGGPSRLAGVRDAADGRVRALPAGVAPTPRGHEAQALVWRRDALDRALRDALVEIHPHLRDIDLVNFKVRILDETKGTGAVTRVLLDASDSEQVWGSIGVSENIIEASWEALVDSLEFGMQAGRRPAESWATPGCAAS